MSDDDNIQFTTTFGTEPTKISMNNVFEDHPTPMKTGSSRTLPEKFFDGHHHYVDTKNHAETFHQFLSQFLPDTTYLPDDYHNDVVVPLQDAGIDFVGSIHMEAIPSNGLGEAQWVSEFMNDKSKDGGVDNGSSKCPVKGIVASCHLAAASENQVKSELQKLTDPTNFASSKSSSATTSSSSPVKGIRWILDCVGKFNGEDATHIATKRHDGIDYLRSGGGGGGGGVVISGGDDDDDDGRDNTVLRYDGSVVPEFERGFALLGSKGLTFDLQCAPVQLFNAATLCSKYPDTKVVIDHMGKPRMVLGTDLLLLSSSGEDYDKNDATTTTSTNNINPNLDMDHDELQVWRDGMKEMSKCPNVYCKISMLGYIIPGWTRTQQRKDLMKSLVLETVELFGPKRCMVCTNYWKDGAMSDSDGLSNVGPTPLELISWLYGFLKESYSEDDLEWIFNKTATSFYGIE